MEKKYKIELTETQLRLISKCVEDCHRFMSGQYELWNMTSLLDNYSEIQDELKNLKNLITPKLPFNASYGWSGGDCPNKQQREFIAQTYPIYREIIHFLTVESGIENTYSSPTLTCKEGGSPIKIEKI